MGRAGQYYSLASLHCLSKDNCHGKSICNLPFPLYLSHMPSSHCQLTPALIPSYKNILWLPELLQVSLLLPNREDSTRLPPSAQEHKSLRWCHGQDGCRSSRRHRAKRSCASVWAGTLHWERRICSFPRQSLAVVVSRLQMSTCE